MNDQTLESLLRDPVNTGITLVFALLATVALFYVHKLTRYLADLAGVKVTDAQQQMIDDAVMKGIAYAEEQAHKVAPHASGLPAQAVQEDKMHTAETAARSIHPQAMADVTSYQFQLRAEAALQSMRPMMAAAAASSSLPPPNPSLRPTSGFRSGVPLAGAIPRASKLPDFPTSEHPTPVERPRGK